MQSNMLSYPKILLKFRRTFSSQVSPERCHAVSYRLDEKGDALLRLKFKIQEQRKKNRKKKISQNKNQFLPGNYRTISFFPAFNTVC